MTDAAFPLETAPWPAFSVTLGGSIEAVNLAAQTLFGERLQAREFGELGEGETSSSNFIPLCAQLSTPLIPLRFRDRDGNVATFLTSISAVPGSEGKCYLFQLFPPPAPALRTNGHGKAEVKGGSVEINAVQKQKLDCAMQLTRTVALDFNNALTTILGHASYVLGRMETSNPWRFSLGEIEKASERASEIAHDLGVFSLEEKDKCLQIEGNLNVLVRRAVQILQTAERKNIVWSQKFEQQMFTVHFDEAKLQQAFVKVLENATEAIENSAQVNGQISVQTRNVDVADRTQDGAVQLARGAYVCVEISDDGCGIEAEALPRIFEPFFTTKTGHRGLGLAWVYGIVSNHGGGVAVSSQPGHGTSVRIYLPAVKKIVEERPVPDEDLSGEGTILFVDDEEMLVSLGQMLLASAGYKVLTANSAEQALEVFGRAREPIDLLISDMVMPRMNGRELIERVKARWPATRIICSTACVRTAGTVKNYNFLSKPFTAHELLRLVKSALAATN